MKYPICMKVLAAIEKLEHYGFNCWSRNGMAGRLGMMVDNLEKVMFGILKHHEDTLVFEDNLNEADDVHVTQF